MRIIWIYFALSTLTLAICDNLQSTSETTILEPLAREIIEDTDVDDTSQNLANHRLEDDEDNDSNKPVLPPIILLDFANDPDDNSTSDEKSKRTINNELGYGYLKNNVLSGKFNYYFPGGKSGTTVSIEESISPFQPKTIIESFKSSTERPSVSSSTYQPDLIEQVDQPIAQPWTATFPSNQPIFGQRTKLRKAPPNTFTYEHVSSTAQPDYKNHNIGFTTPRPFSHRYHTHPTTPDYNSKYNVFGLTPPNSGFSHESPTTSRPLLSDDPTVFNIPRYTVENGIKYENKIIWKYPDGRIADPSPASYINSYSEFSNSQMNKGSNKNTPFKTSLTHQSPPLVNPGLGKFRNNNPNYPSISHQSSRFSTEPSSNIHSQRPAQFPMDQESNFQSRPSASSSAHSFDFSYQDNFGLRQRGNAVNTPVRNDRLPIRPSLSLPVDSDDADYTYAPPARPFSLTTQSPNRATDNGKSTSQVISKYPPQVQKYASKVFGNDKNEEQHQSQQYQSSNYNSAAFIKNNYDNILNYNPSISQYIRDPSSILNAQPTFIRAGDSLVPVIILRVDGARPIETQPSSNINLKSLLQQYIANYAGNQVANQNYGYDDRKVSAHADSNNLLNDLTQFTQALRRYSPNGDINPTKTSSQLRLADHPLNYDETRYTPKTSYDVSEGRTDLKDQSRLKSNDKARKLPKVKSVEIISGPHIPNYRDVRQN